jgi:hypothetical protein
MTQIKRIYTDFSISDYLPNQCYLRAIFKTYQIVQNSQLFFNKQLSGKRQALLKSLER